MVTVSRMLAMLKKLTWFAAPTRHPPIYDDQVNACGGLYRGRTDGPLCVDSQISESSRSSANISHSTISLPD